MKNLTKRPPQQLDFQSLLPNKLNNIEGKVAYNKVHVSRATFLAGLATKVHRWFRLTPSFGPALVQDMLTNLCCQQDEVVLDPFAGAATTMIECQLEGRTSFGFELNPFLHFVGNTSLNWQVDLTAVQNALSAVVLEFKRLNNKISFENLETYNLRVPSIHNPYRWWRPDVLKELLVLKFCIETTVQDIAVKNILRLALAGALVPELTNVTLGRLQLHFIDRSNDIIDVIGTFVAHCTTIIDDLLLIRPTAPPKTSQVLHRDSTKVGDLRLKSPVNCVITSPPYPNRYSYTWNTRPHLYMLDFISSGKEAAALDKTAIGGTWGSATSELAKGKVEPEFKIVKDAVGPIVKEILKQDALMANYVMKYFNLLAKQIVSMDHLLASNARVAYVVGCSRIRGVFIETDVLLAKIFEGLSLGYKIASIDRIRKRNSGKDLHESIVYAWKV